jgi:hypothetical protein
MYIRKVNINRDGERYGTYFQAVRSYREQGKVKQDVVHLGEYSTVEEALIAWTKDIGEFERIGRPRKAAKLRAKMERLRTIS